MIWKLYNGGIKLQKNGLTQEQFDEGVNTFVNNAIAIFIQMLIEMDKLGDSGRERIEAAELWSKKHLSSRSLYYFF